MTLDSVAGAAGDLLAWACVTLAPKAPAGTGTASHARILAPWKRRSLPHSSRLGLRRALFRSRGSGYGRSRACVFQATRAQRPRLAVGAAATPHGTAGPQPNCRPRYRTGRPTGPESGSGRANGELPTAPAELSQISGGANRGHPIMQPAPWKGLTQTSKQIIDCVVWKMGEEQDPAAAARHLLAKGHRVLG